MPSSPSLARHPDLDQWLAILPEGKIRVRTGKVDIGQRVSTALAMITAEELDVDPARITISRTRTGRDPNEGVTASSVSMEESGNAIRAAAATARRHLLDHAAGHLGVEAADLEVDDGTIRSRATNRIVSYWDLQQDRPFNIPVDVEAPVKPSDQHRIIGTAATPRHMHEIASGTFDFIHDMSFPDMLHARVVRPPHYHARLKSLDQTLVDRLARQDITVVRNGHFLAVAGANEYEVTRAAEQVDNRALWDPCDGLKEQDLFTQLTANDRSSLPVVAGTPVEEPVPALGEPPDEAVATLSARFEKPYHMHGSIGPSAAVAIWQDDGLKLWSHSQGVYMLRDAVAEALDLKPEMIEITHAPGAGCYGHNGADDAAFDAALVARALPGVPILMKWTREQEHAWSPYASCMVLELRAAVDSDANVIEWSHESYADTFNMRPRTGPNKAGASRLLASRYLPDPPPPYVPVPALINHMGIHRNLDPLYVFPRSRLVKNLVRDLPLRSSALRTLGAFGNVFAIECFMDELAEATSTDPATFRIRHLDDERAKETISTVWRHLGASPKPEGRGRGLGFAQYKNRQAYAAVGVELEVTDAADVRLHKMVIAADAGEIVDRAGLTAQMEGGALQAASWTLYEEVTFDRGGITSRDWDSYPILSFENVPEIETILMERPGQPFLGAGEAVSGPTGAAIGNAIRDATGLRLRRMPFTRDAIRAAAMAD